MSKLHYAVSNWWSCEALGGPANMVRIVGIDLATLSITGANRDCVAAKVDELVRDVSATFCFPLGRIHNRLEEHRLRRQLHPNAEIGRQWNRTWVVGPASRPVWHDNAALLNAFYVFDDRLSPADVLGQLMLEEREWKRGPAAMFATRVRFVVGTRANAQAYAASIIGRESATLAENVDGPIELATAEWRRLPLTVEYVTRESEPSD